MSSPELDVAIAEVWKRESKVVVAVALRIVRDLGLAEELAQDALLAAFEAWSRSGVPTRPGAWLVTVVRNRAVNAVRRDRMIERKSEVIRHEPKEPSPAPEDRMDDELRDEVLELLFTACHPVLPRESRVALTLRLIGGLSTAEIARSFLVSEPTIAQRIVRAKRALSESDIAYEVPGGEALAPRLASVLDVVYLVFNEGYSATAGEDVVRPALVDEALRLATLLADLAPDEPEVHGLLALMLLQSSRSAARSDADGEPVLLMDQDRSRWDRARIEAGNAALQRATALGGLRGAFQIQAAIAAVHARADAPARTDWPAIATLYAELARVSPSPVVELNRAMAISRAEGPAAGLARLDALRDEPALASYPWLPSARADLLFQLGRRAEAGIEFARAAELTDNVRQRVRLLARAAACAE
jgi:RNA polymerase sigma factor (sigma-70 family)